MTTEITRYNYAHQPNCDLRGLFDVEDPAICDPDHPNHQDCYDPRVAPNPELDLGEPDPGAEPGYDWAYNAYAPDGVGQDKLLSFTTYLFDPSGQPVLVRLPIYTAYEYNAGFGQMGRKISWDGYSNTLSDRQFTYRQGRVESVIIDESTWPQDLEQRPVWGVDRERMLEVYAYNIFGERVGVMHCSQFTWDDYSPPDWLAAVNCKGQTRSYDYVDGQPLVERDDALLVSVYTWGVMGVVARRGVSVRNGSWDPNAGTECEPGVMTGEFEDDDPVMRGYTYMTDAMGNVAALVDSDGLTARRQVFDAFGNIIDGYVTFRCASDHDWADAPCHLGCPGGGPPYPCPRDEPQPIERMQTGGYNWRGGEGSITDRVAEDMPDTEDYSLRWSAYTRPSTGLIYKQNRYYEPETGRFTQADPVRYGLEILRGQNNRWTYCANDPVNRSDPTGLIGAVVYGFLGGLSFGLGVAMGIWLAAAPPPPLLKALLQALGITVGASICTLTLEQIAKQLFLKTLAAFGAMLGLLAVAFVVGMVVGYLIASNVKRRSNRRFPSEEPLNEDSLRRVFACSERSSMGTIRSALSQTGISMVHCSQGVRIAELSRAERYTCGHFLT